MELAVWMVFLLVDWLVLLRGFEGKVGVMGAQMVSERVSEKVDQMVIE